MSPTKVSIEISATTDTFTAVVDGFGSITRESMAGLLTVLGWVFNETGYVIASKRIV